MMMNEAKLAATAAVFAVGAESKTDWPLLDEEVAEVVALVNRATKFRTMAAKAGHGEYSRYLLVVAADAGYSALQTPSAETSASLGYRTLYDVLGLGD